MRISGDSKLSDRRVEEWFLLQKARKERQDLSPAPAPRSAEAPPVITISRQYGAGGHTVGNGVAQALGADWQVWDREIIDAVAESAHARRDMVEALDERVRGWMDEMTRSLFQVAMLEAYTYRHHLALVLLALGQQGHKVIIGRGANFVLPQALNVRLCAAHANRVGEVERREGLTRDEAQRKVAAEDRNRAEFSRTVFGRDVDDPGAYDVIFMTDTLKEEVAVAAIVAAARATFSLK